MEQIPTHMYEYGILGILVSVFGWALWQQWARTNKKNEVLEKRIDQLQEQMRKYLDEEKSEMLQVLRENTQAFIELKETIHQLLPNASKPHRKSQGELKIKS